MGFGGKGSSRERQLIIPLNDRRKNQLLAGVLKMGFGCQEDPFAFRPGTRESTAVFVPFSTDLVGLF
jgi:hypothetical protein